MKRLFILLVTLLTSAAMFAQQQPCDSAVVNVDTLTFKTMLAKHDGSVIDVRTPEEFKTGFINGAINIDFRSAEFQEKINELDKTKTYYVYCESGRRSAQATAYMKAQGFCRVIELKGGMVSWRAAGYLQVVPK
jgi:phage shock protein E